MTMHYKMSTADAIEFRYKLGLNQYDIPLSKEQSVMTKIICKRKNIATILVFRLPN